MTEIGVVLMSWLQNVCMRYYNGTPLQKILHPPLHGNSTMNLPLSSQQWFERGEWRFTSWSLWFPRSFTTNHQKEGMVRSDVCSWIAISANANASERTQPNAVSKATSNPRGPIHRPCRRTWVKMFYSEKDINSTRMSERCIGKL